MKAPFQPLGLRVLIQRDAPAAVSRGGIALPVEAQEKSRVGTVRAVGAPVTDIPVGAKVLLPDFSTQELRFDGVTYELHSVDSILGIIG